VILSGGPDDLATPRAVAQAMQCLPLDLAGQTSLGQLAALAERCDVAIGPDSGPLHLAAAVGTQTVRLYGPSDELIYGPWAGHGVQAVLSHELPCRPCRDFQNPPCGAPTEPPCLLGLSVDDVVETACRALRAAAPAAAPRLS
jgi:ADP-heptose:LPS heptosyltransferase